MSAWNGSPLALDGGSATSSRVAAVSRIPTSKELWRIAQDGSVQAASWYEGASWHRYELAPAGSASTNGGIAAVSRIPSSTEMWFVGANGSIARILELHVARIALAHRRTGVIAEHWGRSPMRTAYTASTITWLHQPRCIKRQKEDMELKGSDEQCRL